MRDRWVLERACEGIGSLKAKTILDEVGSLESLESLPLAEFLNIDGVGQGTADSIGIWNEKGVPVGQIPRNPCPVCGDNYDSREKGTVDVSNPLIERVCPHSEFKDSNAVVFIHES